MNFNFYFGPNKTPFLLQKNGMVEKSSNMPFHGIVSRGLLNKLLSNFVPIEVWYRNAYLLEMEELPSGPLSPEFSMLREFAFECKVLSFKQSASCARLFIENHCKDFLLENNVQCDIWNIKEGHTSSVWKVSIYDSASKEQYHIVNVARDQEASLELETTSRRMQAISAHSPAINMAKVYDLETIFIKFDGEPLELIVTRNEYIENSFEIHSTKIEDQFVLVERFLTSEDAPSQITSIYGRAFTEQENVKIANDIAFFLNTASSAVYPPPTLNINDGDVVWNGETAIIVAIS